MAVQPLSPQEIAERLPDLPGWSVDDDELVRSYKLPSHPAGAAMVVHIAQVQEEEGHHAELTLGYNTLAVRVNTHSVGGRLTELDFGLARRIEDLAPGHGAR
jgi:4a-hydroxytetrahydrobiopterin dehydratase